MTTIFGGFLNFLFKWNHLNSYSGQPRGYSGSQDRNDRMTVKFKTQKIPLGFQQNPKKSLAQKLTTKNSQAKFLTLNDIHESHRQLFRKGVRKKVHATIPIWDMINTLSSSHWICGTYFCCFLLALPDLRICLWRLVTDFQVSLRCSSEETANLKLPKIHFGIVTCVFLDNLSQHSCNPFY